jgi:uncharacterized protein YwqG
MREPLVAPLAHKADAIAALVRPAVELSPVKAAGGDAGACRFGGVPDVGPGFRWPRHRGLPLMHLLQLDLTVVRDVFGASPLPESGTLNFFYDEVDQPWGIGRSDRWGWRVRYWPAGTPLRPVDVPRYYHRAAPPPVGAEPRLVMTMPSTRSTEIEWLLEPDEIDLYEQTVAGPDRVAHQLLGHPAPIQHDPRDYAAEVAGPGVWLSLLQLDSDERLGWMWGDAGKLHWMIRADHVAARDFSQVWLSLQCC